MTDRFSARRILAAAPLWALAGIFLSASWSRAQDAPEPRHHMENRFLFVIDTASAMKSRASGVEEAVVGLLASGMKGQLRKGDTIGLWTYSDRLDTDFPKLVWSEKKRDDIVSQVRDHLRELHYARRAHLEKVLPDIHEVVAHSERVTVILVFDGAELTKLTPFDKDINGLDKRYAREFKEAHAPFVTLLAARDGAVFDYTINYPGTVVVPPTADPVPPPETNKPLLLAVAPPPPVIVPPPVEPAPPPHIIEITLSGSNFAHKASAPPPSAPDELAVVAPPAAAVPAVVANAPPPAAAAPPPAEAVNTNVAAAEPAPAPPVSTPPPAAPATPARVAPPAIPVAVAAPVSTAQQVAMIVMAFSLLTIAVVLVLVLFLVRRSRGGSQPSLISQSIDRTR